MASVALCSAKSADCLYDFSNLFSMVTTSYLSFCLRAGEEILSRMLFTLLLLVRFFGLLPVFKRFVCFLLGTYSDNTSWMTE